VLALGQAGVPDVPARHPPGRAQHAPEHVCPRRVARSARS
jgi:hypothetical protein